MNLALISLLVTIALAIVGFIVTYLNSLRLEKRKERLALVDLRLNEFYGPLYVATRAGAIVFAALRKKLSRDEVFPNRREPDPKAFSEWKIWLVNVFMPLNDVLERLILNKAHLIREPEMPECLLLFVAHNAAYKAVLKKWERNDFSDYLSIIDFPVEIEQYALNSFKELKSEQLRLIGLVS